MKLHRFLPLLGLAALLAGCDDDFQYPPVVIPQATMVPNHTIAELKQMYWDAPADFPFSASDTYRNTWYNQIGTDENGDSIIIAGTIISSDRSGNIYKNLMVRDESGDHEAITFAINKLSTDSILSRAHKQGQRIVINVTGMYIGKYRNYMEVGSSSSSYGITYMPRADFDAHSQVDGLPGSVEPFETTISELMAAKTTDAGLQKWQSQLIRINGVTFEDGGKAVFAPNSTNTDRYVVDESGKRINVRCSGYSLFANTTIPTGRGDLVGILGYFGTDWQILLVGIDRNTDLIGFNWDLNDDPDTPDVPAGDGDGTKEKPYTTAQVVAFNPQSTSDVASEAEAGVWVSGYIVGSYKDYTANIGLANANNQNVLIGASADATTDLVCVQLPYGDIRTAVNLVDNPGNLGKKLAVKGDILKYNSMPGVKNTSEYELEGGSVTPTPDPDPTPSASGTFTKATSVVSGKQYILVHGSNGVSIPIAQNKQYGYLLTEEGTLDANGNITTSMNNAVKIQASGNGYTMLDCYDRYISMDETHSSFQLYTSIEAGSVWSIAVDASSQATISNTNRDGFVVRWADNYSNFAPNNNGTGDLPVLYVKVD